MRCPHCNSQVTHKSLVHRRRAKVRGVVRSPTELRCPQCDGAVKHSAATMWLVGLGFSSWVLGLLLVLVLDVPKSAQYALVIAGGVGYAAALLGYSRWAKLEPAGKSPVELAP